MKDLNLIGTVSSYIDERILDRLQFLFPNYPLLHRQRIYLESDYDIVNVGDDIAFINIDYEMAGIKGLNWGMIGQNIDFDLKIVYSFYSILKNGGKLVFPLSMNQLLDSNKTIEALYDYLLPSNRRNNVISKISKKTILFDHRLRRFTSIKHKENISLSSIKHGKGVRLEIIDRLKSLASFCNERDLDLLIIFLPCPINIQRQFSIVYETVDRIVNIPDIHVLNYLDDSKYYDPDMYITSGQILKAQYRVPFTKEIFNF